jgi:hypothetical protein
MQHMGASVPEVVGIVYRYVGNTHVFTSKGIRGVVHCGGSELEDAFNQVIACLNHHVSEVYDCEAEYKSVLPFDDFAHHLASSSDISANFLTLTLDTKLVDCQ